MVHHGPMTGPTRFPAPSGASPAAGLPPAVRRMTAADCAADGRPRMFLWVLKGNTRARRFYERAGFRADGAEEPFEADGVTVPEVRYATDLRG
ncbi:hypothetical protein HG826_28780 [Streptomyces sp. GMY01]|nr:hypothetical protein [Streptomyces sp. GMY02]